MPDPVAWAFTAGGEFSEQLNFLTDIMGAATGPEQRNRLRDTPVVRVGFSGLAQGDERRRLDQALSANGSGTWLVPWLVEGSPSPGAVGPGTDLLLADTRWRHYAVGGRVLLVHGNAAEELEVASLTDGTIGLTDVVIGDWPPGTMIYPAFRGRLDAMPQLPRFTGDASAYNVTFRNDEPIDWPASAGTTAYRGMPVLDIPVDWTIDPEDAPDREVELVANDMSLPFAYDPVGAPRNRIRFTATLDGLDQVATLRSLAYALAGCWGVIWIASKAQDLRVVAAVADDATTIDVAYTGLSDGPLLDNRRDIRITLAGGTTYYRRITAAALQSPGVERLTVDSAFAAGFAPGSVVQTAFLQLCRQEGDASRFNYWKHDVVTTILEFRGEARHGL